PPAGSRPGHAVPLNFEERSLHLRCVPADDEGMDKRGDPQVIVFLERSAEFARRLEFEQARIAALRSSLDGLWASHREPDGEVTWTFRPRLHHGDDRIA
ncbi:MAG: hypothetical protein LC118_02605, partial [Dehalococcoidia bacterium]|nr:hypothetical protein [Dehalococcoidia bacterium]